MTDLSLIFMKPLHSTDAAAGGPGQRSGLAGEPVITSVLGVSPVDWDTRLLARRAAELDGRSVLDMGTGTGFVAIYLALQNIDSTGVDINPAAVRCARDNARANDIDIAIHQSDLFASLDDRYDLIVFNPPYGNSGSVRTTRLLEIAKSLLPKESRIIRRIAYRLIRRPRARLLQRFLGQCRDHLRDGGRVLLLLHETELALTAGFSSVEIDRHKEFRLLVLKPSQGTAADPVPPASNLR